jgi:hypothetical protein
MLRRLVSSVLFLGSVTAVFGQAGSPFQIRVEQGGQAAFLPSGSTVNVVASGINAPTTITVTVTYRGTATATISAVDLVGSTEFALATTPALPAQLPANSSSTLSIRYTPRSSQSAQGQLQLTGSEGAPGGATSTPFAVQLNFLGSTPAFGLAYVLQVNGNVIPVAEGGTILFPTTQVGSNNVANVLLTNNGSAPLTIRSITFTPSTTPSDFQLIGLPLLPTTVNPGQAAQFTIRYAPLAGGQQTAALEIGLADRTANFNVQASAVGPVFTYELIDGETRSPLVPDQAAALPDTDVGTTRSFVVQVNNTGDGDGQIQQISVLGPGFQVADLPFLPATLVPGSSIFFTLNFTPVQPGRSIGRMRVGNNNFEFSASTLGARLVYTYDNGGVAVPVQPNGTISFNPAPLGSQTDVNFTLTNTGTAEAIIPGISTTSISEFTVLGLPRFPVTIQPNGRLSFRVTFSPATVGPANSTLRVNNVTFDLLGIGNRPPNPPGYTIRSGSGVADSFQQIPVSLTLDAPYSLPIRGTLTLGFSSAGFAVDPALQFATGGRTVDFTIPGGTTEAIFPNGSAQIGLQTGTVAGTISVTPVLTVANNFNLTATGTNLTLGIQPRAPAVLAVELIVQSQTAASVLVTGFANSRTLTRLNLDLAPKAGTTFQGGQVTVDLSTSAAVWFRGATSQNFGSLFTITVPFSVGGLDPTTGQTLAQVLGSISATLTNEIGTSAAVTTAFP